MSLDNKMALITLDALVHDCIIANRLHEVRSLLAMSYEAIDLNWQDSNNRGRTAAILASMRGNKEALRLMVQEGADILQETLGTVILHASKGFGSAGILDFILEQRCVDLNQIHFMNIISPLMNACFMGEKEYCSIFLREKGILVNLANKNGDTALTLCCGRGNIEHMVELLKHPGINTLHRNEAGLDAFDLSIQADQKTTAALLLVYNTGQINDKLTGP